MNDPTKNNLITIEYIIHSFIKNLKLNNKSMIKTGLENKKE